MEEDRKQRSTHPINEITPPSNNASQNESLDESRNRRVDLDGSIQNFITSVNKSQMDVTQNTNETGSKNARVDLKGNIRNFINSKTVPESGEDEFFKMKQGMAHRRTQSAKEITHVRNNINHCKIVIRNEHDGEEFKEKNFVESNDNIKFGVGPVLEVGIKRNHMRTCSANEISIVVPTNLREQLVVKENDAMEHFKKNMLNAINKSNNRKVGICPENLIENALIFAKHDEEPYHPRSRHESVRGYQHTLPAVLSGVPLDMSTVSRTNSIRHLDGFTYSNLGQGYRSRKPSVFSIGNTSDPGSIGRDFIEKIPGLNLYRCNTCEIQRPTLFQLRQAGNKVNSASSTNESSAPLAIELKDDEEAGKAHSRNDNKSVVKFGWVIGVFLRCVLNIFGVMLFLRITWMTGQSGIGFSSVIILISMLVVLLTTTSMSAICTNGEVGAGGTYYMISRSLGPEFGCSIGIVFSFANAVGVSMNILGFAETVRDIMWEYGVTITNDRINDVRVLSVLGCGLCLFIVLVGMEWESKAQMLFLVLMIVSLANYFVGTVIPPNEDKKWMGYIGYNGKSFRDNFGPHYTSEQNFFTVFAIFFPSYTGVLAGATISGDLRNPSKAIPKGTFWSIAVTTIVYLGIVWTCGSTMVLEAVGKITQSERVIPLSNDTVHNETLYYPATMEFVQNCSIFGKTCAGGLLWQTDMVGIASIFRPLVYPGIFAATLSSAFGCMICAPKTFQALGNDRLFPGIRFFAKGYGKNGEPFRAYILCFMIASSIVLIGSLDVIAPIISNFFLMSFALINFSCFDASMANSPGFRPGYKYYNKWMSLLGALICLAVMFLINWWGALITIVVVAGLYIYVRVTKPDVNWGSSTQANVYSSSLNSALKLVNLDDHVKNYRPQILLLSGNPRTRSGLVDFAAAITKKQSLLMCGHIVQVDMEIHSTTQRSVAVYKWFQKRKIKSFYSIVHAPTLRIGAQIFLQTLGVGKLRPNTLMMGFKHDWLSAEPADVLDYFNIIQDAFDLQYAVGILRIEGCDKKKIAHIPNDSTEANNDSDVETDDEIENVQAQNESTKYGVTQQSNIHRKDQQKQHSVILTAVHRRIGSIDNSVFEGDFAINGRIPELHQQLRMKHYGTIDVWWLYDDGGLTLLIPYILCLRKQWKHCKLRIFCLAHGDESLENAKESMDLLLNKFRIEYTELNVLTDVSKRPQLSTYQEFEKILSKWRIKPDEIQDDYPWKISDTYLKDNKHKIYRHLRLREKLLECSRDASLIVMTLPVPTTTCLAGLYMGFLEMLTRDMPPILLLRGNQESVLTYYS